MLTYFSQLALDCEVVKTSTSNSQRGEGKITILENPLRSTCSKYNSVYIRSRKIAVVAVISGFTCKRDDRVNFALY